MKATDALRLMVRSSGKTALEISARIGRKPNYVSSLLSRGSTPTVETFASIAEACGGQLLLSLPSQDIVLDGWEIDYSSAEIYDMVEDDIPMSAPAGRQR